jgi:ankyrin repeat protein
MKQLLLTTIAAVVLVGCGTMNPSFGPLSVAEPPELPKVKHLETDALLQKHGGKTTKKELKAATEPVAEASQQKPTAKTPDISFIEAVKAGNIEAVKQHLAAGVDVNAKYYFAGERPLHVAVKYGHKKIVSLFINNDADVNAKNPYGKTSLHYATDQCDKDIAELLIAEGADVNAKSPNGWIPLHRAAICGDKDIVELLIAKGADVNAKTNLGTTPLHEAANGHKEAAELLIDNGADVNAKKAERQGGGTPLDNAIFYHPKTADLLRKHGAKTAKELKAELK